MQRGMAGEASTSTKGTESARSSERSRLFSRERDLILVAALGLILNSILRGIRSPGRFTYTNLLFNYDFGFSRRGLLGAIISTVHVPYFYSYEFFFWLSVAIFAAEVALLVELLLRLSSLGNGSAQLRVLVFSSSLGAAWLAHSMGYLEHLGLVRR